MRSNENYAYLFNVNHLLLFCYDFNEPHSVKEANKKFNFKSIKRIFSSLNVKRTSFKLWVFIFSLSQSVRRFVKLLCAAHSCLPSRQERKNSLLIFGSIRIIFWSILLATISQQFNCGKFSGTAIATKQKKSSRKRCKNKKLRQHASSYASGLLLLAWNDFICEALYFFRKAYAEIVFFFCVAFVSGLCCFDSIRQHSDERLHIFH